MITVINIPISKKPNFIIVSSFSEYHYHHYCVDNLESINKHCDVGCWRIKYKTEAVAE